MLGAIIGDIVGSRFKWDNIKTKDFDFLTEDCYFTDDTVMTLAIARAFSFCMQIETISREASLGYLKRTVIDSMRYLGWKYPDAGYGGSFEGWLHMDNPMPYKSYGNGAAMRVSACGFAATSLDEALDFAERVTSVTHNHPEGIRGAKATATAIFLARCGCSKTFIRDYVEENFYYSLDFTLDEIRDSYEYDVTCQGTVPQALVAFLESTDFEDAIRNAISIGGDSDTLAAITGGIAEAFYGVPDSLYRQVLHYLPEELIEILREFRDNFQRPDQKNFLDIEFNDDL